MSERLVLGQSGVQRVWKAFGDGKVCAVDAPFRDLAIIKAAQLLGSEIAWIREVGSANREFTDGKDYIFVTK